MDIASPSVRKSARPLTAVMKRSQYEQLFVSVDAALQAYKSHKGELGPIDHEVMIELRSLRMWLTSILRLTPSDEQLVVSESGARGSVREGAGKSD